MPIRALGYCRALCRLSVRPSIPLNYNSTANNIQLKFYEYTDWLASWARPTEGSHPLDFHHSHRCNSSQITVKLGTDKPLGRISDEFLLGRHGSLIKQLMSWLIILTCLAWCLSHGCNYSRIAGKLGKGQNLGQDLGQVHSCKMWLIIPPASTKLKGGYTGFTLSVCGQNPVRSVSLTILIGSFSYLHILSSYFRRCVACNVCFKKKNEILANSLNLLIWLCLLLNWDRIIQYDLMVWVIMRLRGVSSERRCSSCSS